VFIALLGIAAVALTWWLARAIAGPASVAGSVAGALAGLLLAVSPAAIEESTFIWNPNPIGFFAVLALAAAWRGRTSARGSGKRWWALALGAGGAVTQLHVLGVVFLFAILVLALLDLRRDRSVAIGIAGGLALVAVLFVPLTVHELQSGFQETRLVLDYLRSGDTPISGGR
jgi:4-amino-4-deoxy-L-arabinose transferase-like glycosyltransferase